MNGQDDYGQNQLSANSLEYRKFLRRKKYKTIVLFITFFAVLIFMAFFVQWVLEEYFKNPAV